MDLEPTKIILGYFLEDTKNCIQILRECFQDFQKITQDTQEINKLFRVTFSLRGQAGMLSFSWLSKFASSDGLEKSFHFLKNHPDRVDDQLAYFLFQAVDLLSEAIERLAIQMEFTATDNNYFTVKSESLLAEIDRHLNYLHNSTETEVSSLAINQTASTDNIYIDFIKDTRIDIKYLKKNITHLITPIKDSEEIYELFRISDSIKVGAAMLGFSSISKYASFLDDYFISLKNNQMIVNDHHNLQSFLLNIINALETELEIIASTLETKHTRSHEVSASETQKKTIYNKY